VFKDVEILYAIAKYIDSLCSAVEMFWNRYVV